MKTTGGYRCVNFHDLCRLCCSPASGAANGVQIFEADGGSLQKKILECLSISLNENDKLPKSICSNCKEYIEVFTEFRKSSKNAQKMLEGCLNTSKLRNGGQVYIKDEIPIKKVLKPIQNPSPTKIVPNLNLCNIIATSPTKQQQQQQVKKSIASPSQPQDFLSSIMQAVGIQTGEDMNDTSQQQQQAISMLPQYTLTLDNNTMKSGQIQYKIENAGNMHHLTQAPMLTARNIQDIQNQQVTLNQVDEFLKLKQMPGLILKKDSKNLTLTTAASKSQSDEPKDKKPKFNLILQATKPAPTPTKTQQPQILSPQSKATFTSPSKAQILNIEKLLPMAQTSSPAKQLVLVGGGNALMSSNDAASQIFGKAQTQQQQQQPVLVQMKLQPNADGQLTLTPVQTTQQQPLQFSLSPQQLQQLNFQTLTQQTHHPSISVQPAQLAIQTVAAATPTAQDIQTQTVSAPIEITSQDKIDDEDNDQNNDAYDDDFYPADDDESVLNESQEKAPPIKKTSALAKKTVKTLKPSKVKTKVTDSSLTELQSVNAEHSDMAKKQLSQLTSFTSKRAETTEPSNKSNDLNMTVCDVCKKVFKRKEFLLQHLKSHIGIRPFKCTDASCNKAFSRKEHLLRHISSHTGNKEFICNVCNKLFSRKDNLNKHKRIHPEASQQGGARHNCQNCGKSFPIRSQLVKHQATCDSKISDSDEPATKETKVKAATPIVKKIKIKTDKKPEIAKTITLQSNQQPKIVQVLQQQQQQQIAIKTEAQPQQMQQQLITLSMSQASQLFSSQQQSKVIYTFPSTNFILNPNGTNTATSSNELKFDTIQ